MATHSRNDEDKLVQLNTTIRKRTKARLNDAAWRRRKPMRELVEQILDEWLSKNEVSDGS